MGPNPFLGVIFHWIGGFASATNFIPFRGIKRWSWEIYWLIQGFAARWPNTQNGTIDFGIMVTTVYADRALQVAFTRPYIDSGIVVVVKKDSPIKTIADLNKADNTVAHLTAPVQEERGKRLYPNAKFLTFDAISAQGEYLGGAICPGVQISADALFQRAARLPRIDVKKPSRIVGRTTG